MAQMEAHMSRIDGPMVQQLPVDASTQVNSIDRYTNQSGGADAAFDAAKSEMVSSWGSSLAAGVRYAQMAVPQDASNAGAKGKTSAKRDGKDGEDPVTLRRSAWDDDDGSFGDAPGGTG